RGDAPVQTCRWWTVRSRAPPPREPVPEQRLVLRSVRADAKTARRGELGRAAIREVQRRARLETHSLGAPRSCALPPRSPPARPWSILRSTVRHTRMPPNGQLHYIEDLPLQGWTGRPINLADDFRAGHTEVEVVETQMRTPQGVSTLRGFRETTWERFRTWAESQRVAGPA